MKSGKYWKARMTALSKRQIRMDQAALRRIAQDYQMLVHALNEDLAVFYARYAANAGISMAAARRLLTNAERETFRMTLKEFRDKAKAGGYDRELNEVYLRSRISRLKALQTQIDMRTYELYQSQHDLLFHHLADGYMDTYYRTLHTVQTGVGITSAIAKLDTETVEALLRKPWMGSDFSARVWSDRDKLLRELRITLSQAFTRGDPLERTAALLAKRMGVAKSRAMTLVATESAHFAAQATARGYARTGVTQYDFLASLDERTCEICAPLDSMTFPCAQAQTGINYPPMHPRCRCTTVPHFDEDFGVPKTRAARDATTGKTVIIPDMSYQAWFAQYVNG